MILLIEDRQIRQQKAMLRAGYRLEEYADILDNATGERYEQIYDDLKKDCFCIDNYDFIIAHSSAFGDDNSLILHKLETLCDSAMIPLVLFSGGQSVIYYDSKKSFAHISSLHLYSKNLVTFLQSYQKDEETDMLKLLYGEKWMLYLLLHGIEQVNLFLQRQENNTINYKRFDRECDVINLLETISNLYNPKKDGKNIPVIEIEKFYNSLRQKVSEIVDG